MLSSFKSSSFAEIECYDKIVGLGSRSEKSLDHMPTLDSKSM